MVFRYICLHGIVSSQTKTYVSSKSKMCFTWEFILKVELHKKGVVQVAGKCIAYVRNQNYILQHKQDKPKDWKQTYSVLMWP